MLCAIIILGMACTQEKTDLPTELLGLKINETLRLGRGSTTTSDATLFNIVRVQHGPVVNIYVADQFTNTIKKFSPNGKLLKTIGGKGCGPGEFIRITGFARLDSSLLVWDQSLRRFTRFSLQGKLEKVYPIEGITGPFKKIYMVNVETGPNYVVLYLGGKASQDPAQRAVAKIYSENFDKLQSFVNIEQLHESVANTSLLFGSYPGNLLFLNNQRVLFIPFVYTSDIYEYQRESSGK